MMTIQHTKHINVRDLMIGVVVATLLTIAIGIGLDFHPGLKTRVVADPIAAPAAVVFNATKFCADNKVGQPSLAPGAGALLYIAYGPDSQELHYTAIPGQNQALWFHKVLNPTTNVREQVQESVDLPTTAIDCFTSKAGR